MRQNLLHRIGLLAIVFLAIAGCGPKSAEEFRKTMIVFHDAYEVPRPYKDVAETLRKKAAECLNVNIKVICTNCFGGRDMGRQTWLSTYITSPERTEVHLQLKRTDLVQIGAPAQGDYEVVLDAVPLDKKRTKIEVYRLRPQEKFISKAMAGWANGDTQGCPDLSSVH